MGEASSTHRIRQNCIKFVYKTKPVGELYLLDHTEVRTKEDNIRSTLISRTWYMKSIRLSEDRNQQINIKVPQNVVIIVSSSVNKRF
jgi:hypothetical protein